jgi:hypothetical protein
MLNKAGRVFILFVFLIQSCNSEKKEILEQPLARVSDLFLYPSDIARQMPAGINGEDSIRIARRIIEEWIKDKLLLKKAEQYLVGSEYTIEKQLEDYRESLLTFKYKQEVILQNLDTIVNDEDIREYYSENSSNYLLNADMVRLTYAKIPVSAPEISLIRSIYRSDDDEDLAKLEKYCVAYAENYTIQSPEWIRFKDFILQIPLNTDNPGRYLNYNKAFEVKDSSYYYFIKVVDYIPETKPAPLEMVAGDIRSVLLNKKKITFLHELENTLYREGLSRNQAEIY